MKCVYIYIYIYIIYDIYIYIYIFYVFLYKRDSELAKADSVLYSYNEVA